MKKTIAVFVLMLTLLLCVSCGGKDYQTVPTADLTANITAALGQSADYMSADADHYEFYFGDEVAFAKVTDCHMVFSRAETDVNEFGIFRVTDQADLAAVKTMVQTYLDGQVDYLSGFAANYSPTDMTKLDNAAVETMGNYVFYYILSETDETTVKATLNELLVK